MKELFKLNLKNMEVPQGICKINDLTLISCYKINSKSIVIIYKDGIRIKEITLPNKAHVGGIAYYPKLSQIFISDTKGYVSSYNYSEFITGNLESRKRIKINDRASSYLTIYNNNLYVGCFNKFKRGIVSVYDLEKNKLKYEFIVPNKIQGLTFYEKDKLVYLLLSKSFKRNKNSKILIYKFSKKTKRYLIPTRKLKLPPMLEQITLDSNKLLLLFESSASIYKSTCKNVIDKIIKIDINKIL